MTAGTWYADVDFITNTPITPDEAMDIAENLAPHGAAVSISRDGEAGGVSLAFNSDSALDASREATRIITGAFNGKLEIVKLDVRNEATMEEEIATPVIPALVGYAEIADIAGVTRQRARQFANLDGFPEPVVVTAAGPLRLKSSVEAWVERRNTKPGRPRVTV